MKEASLSFMTLLAGASLFMAGCSSEDVSGGEQSQRIWKAIVPGAVKGDVAEAGDGTRALFVGGHTNRYGALWDDGDVVQVYRQNGTKVDGQLTPDESSWGTKSATLNGTLTGSFAVEEQLTLYQPSKTMDFTGQKGTLQTASDKTYQTGTVTVESAQENTLTLSNVQLQYLNYYVRFLLSDDDTKERLHPSSLTLHAASGGDIVLTMDEDGNVTTGDLVVNTVVADGAYPGEIFVALKPKDDAHITYELEARVGDDIYVGPITSKTGSGYGTYTPSFTTKGELRKCFRYMKKVSANTLTLSATEASVAAGATTTVTVSENASGGALTVSSSDESVATVSIDGSTITITGVAEGTADITIRSATTEDYASASQTITVTVTASTEVAGNGFTINSSGTKVLFAPGNLQATYNGSSWTWKFAEHQWDYIGDAEGNTKVTDASPYVSGYSGTSTTVDLFGWVGNTSSFAGVAKYGITSSNSFTQYGNSTANTLNDWGTLTITNGGGYTWRTLTGDNGGEWGWILGPLSSPDPGTNCRASGATVNGTQNARWTHATINTDDGNGSVNGLILFPDGCQIDNSSATSWGTINGNSDWGTKCTTAQWAHLAELGCVFLPAAGRRQEASVSNVGTNGYYWSSSPRTSNADYACNVNFNSGRLYPASMNMRIYGYSVRLVRPVE